MNQCNCDLCKVKQDGVHPWHYMWAQYPMRQKLLAIDFAAGKVKPIYWYEMPFIDQFNEQELLKYASK